MTSFFLFILSTAFYMERDKVILRAKNYVMDNYNLKIWKYAKDLKIKIEKIFCSCESRRLVIRNYCVRSFYDEINESQRYALQNVGIHC